MKKHAIIPIFISHRGCPHQCVFCNQRAITARSGDVSVSDARNIIEEWLSSLDGKDIEKEISFFGGSFTGIPIEEQRAFLRLAKKYKDSGRVAKLHCSTRPDYINTEILDGLKEYGMDVIELGVQSFDLQVLEASRRGHSVSDVYSACELIKSYGFTLGIQLMIGLPKDSYESSVLSAKRAAEIKPDIARLYPTVVIADTPLFDMSKAEAFRAFSDELMLKTVKEMYKILMASGVNVIRIGLKSNELIKGEGYHPAFGQLVRSAVALDDILGQLAEIEARVSCETVCEHEASELQGKLIISAPQELINFAAGHQALNKKLIQARYPKLKLSFISDDSIDGIKVCFFDKQLS